MVTTFNEFLRCKDRLTGLSPQPVQLLKWPEGQRSSGVFSRVSQSSLENISSFESKTRNLDEGFRRKSQNNADTSHHLWMQKLNTIHVNLCDDIIDVTLSG